jgi:hypothetical protein
VLGHRRKLQRTRVAGTTRAFSARIVYAFSIMVNKKWNHLSATIGTLFIDMGKLSFGSLMLGSILKGDVDLFQLFIFGAATAMVLFAVGVWFVSMSKE